MQAADWDAACLMTGGFTDAYWHTTDCNSLTWRSFFAVKVEYNCTNTKLMALGIRIWFMSRVDRKLHVDTSAFTSTRLLSALQCGFVSLFCVLKYNYLFVPFTNRFKIISKDRCSNKRRASLKMSSWTRKRGYDFISIYKWDDGE